MKGLSIDEIVNTAALNSKSASQSASKDDIKDRVENGGIFSGVSSPLTRHGEPSTRNNPSNMSMGVTPKQVSIVESTLAKVHQMANGNGKNARQRGPSK